MARPGLIMGMLAAGAAALAMANATTAQVSRSVIVTVVSASGAPVANALVCAGSATDRAALGGGQTNASGTISLSIPAATSGPVLITGGTATAGAAITMPGALGMATLRLPASGGPACPSATQPATAPGQLSAAQVAAVRARAGEPVQPMRGLVGDLGAGQRCFGAAGQNCGDVSGERSTCNSGDRTCQINAGSWLHDECCVRRPEGGMCDGRLEEAVTQVIPGMAQACQGEFNKAVARLGTKFTWKREVDFTIRNTTGLVNHAQFCAPKGTAVDLGLGEQRFCCSGQARPISDAEFDRLDLRTQNVAPRNRIGTCFDPQG